MLHLSQHQLTLIFLKEIEMEAIYQFNLKKLELIDVSSDEASEDPEE